MLEDDNVILVARYKVATPLISGIIEGIPIYQSVTARAFTGSYDYDSVKRHYPKQKPVEDDETIFYISNLKDVDCYHVYTCLRKTLYRDTEAVRVRDYGQTVCSYCDKHYEVGSGNYVYYTSDTTKLHYTRQCPRVTSPDISPITREDAIDSGYEACGRHNCTEDLFGAD